MAYEDAILRTLVRALDAADRADPPNMKSADTGGQATSDARPPESAHAVHWKRLRDLWTRPRSRRIPRIQHKTPTDTSRIRAADST